LPTLKFGPPFFFLVNLVFPYFPYPLMIFHVVENLSMNNIVENLIFI